MTTAALPSAPRARLGELLLVGGVTPVLFLASWALRSAPVDADYAVGFLAFYAAYVVNDPHFTVTYVLFYRDFRARLRGPLGARYALAGSSRPRCSSRSSASRSPRDLPGRSAG